MVVNDQGTPEYLRQDHVSRSKVCLSLRLSPNNRIPSVSRMHFHLQNRSFLLHEAYELPSPLDPFVLQANSEDLVEWAEAALALPNRRQLADDMHQRFKEALPMSRLLPPLLARTEVSRMPATPVMARRPWKISACTFQDSCSGEEPRPRGSKKPPGYRLSPVVSTGPSPAGGDRDAAVQPPSPPQSQLQGRLPARVQA